MIEDRIEELETQVERLTLLLSHLLGEEVFWGQYFRVPWDCDRVKEEHPLFHKKLVLTDR